MIEEEEEDGKLKEAKPVKIEEALARRTPGSEMKVESDMISKEKRGSYVISFQCSDCSVEMCNRSI